MSSYWKSQIVLFLNFIMFFLWNEGKQAIHAELHTRMFLFFPFCTNNSWDIEICCIVWEKGRLVIYDCITTVLFLLSSSNDLTFNQCNLLSMQHSIDYWLWADLIAPESERLLKSVVRVYRQEEADLFYIPFFTTISFFLMEKQQCKALYRVWVLFQECFFPLTVVPVLFWYIWVWL